MQRVNFAVSFLWRRLGFGGVSRVELWLRRECEAYSLACANPDMGNLCFADAEEAAAIEEVRLHCATRHLHGFVLCGLGFGGGLSCG
jgi:hypothetical protein